MRVARVACVSCAAAVLVAHVAWECVRGSCDTCVLLCAAAVLVPTHTHLAHGLRVCVCVPSRVSCAVLGDIYVKAEWACVCAVPCLLFAVLGTPYVKVECCGDVSSGLWTEFPESSVAELQGFQIGGIQHPSFSEKA